MTRSRTETNAAARASATRIVAYASAAFMEQHRDSSLATVRSLPGMLVLRSVVYWSAQALADQLDDAWKELGDGSYLVTMALGPRIRQYVVDVDGAERETTELTAHEAARLPELVRALEAHDSSSMGSRQRQQIPPSSSVSESTPASESVSGSGHWQ